MRRTTRLKVFCFPRSGLFLLALRELVDSAFGGVRGGVGGLFAGRCVLPVSCARADQSREPQTAGCYVFLAGSVVRKNVNKPCYSRKFMLRASASPDPIALRYPTRRFHNRDINQSSWWFSRNINCSKVCLDFNLICSNLTLHCFNFRSHELPQFKLFSFY